MPLFDPDDEHDVASLNGALDESQNELQPLLVQRKSCLEAYQGPHFTNNGQIKGTDPRLSIPLMEIAIDLYGQLLTGDSIRSVVRPRQSAGLPLADSLKEGLDLMVEAIDLIETFQDWVKESLWGFGVCKVGLAFGSAGIPGSRSRYSVPKDIPFADVVDSSNLLLDSQAKKWKRLRWIGDEYLVPLDWAQKSPLFDEKSREQLTTVDPNATRSIGTSASPVKEHAAQQNRMFPMTMLRDVYLPLDNVYLTLGRGVRGKLRSEQWRGPSVGPYHRLGFERVPDTAVARPLAWSWLDAHDSVNELYNKAVRQALRAKRNPIAQAGAEREADRVRQAKDGEWLFGIKTDLIQTFAIPGADPSLLNLVGQLINLFSYMAGNINLLGGLSAQSGTLGQDRLLSGAGSRRMSELQRRSKRAFGKVLSSLSWYLFQERKLKMLTERRVGTASIPVILRHSDLKGRFLEFGYEIEPIRHKSPDERLGSLLQWIQQVIIPLRPDMAQAGQRIDMEAVNRIGRDYGDIPELDQVVTSLGRRATPQEQGVLAGKARGSPGANGRQGGAGGGGAESPALSVPATQESGLV